MNSRTILLVAAALSLAGCNMQPKGSAPASRPAVKVETMTVGMEGEMSASRHVGEVIPDKSVVITASYPGTLVSLNVKKGEMVQQGALIGEISSQSVRSSLEIAEATLKQAEDGYERVRQVYGSGSVSQVQMVDIETKLAKARASVDAARQAADDCRMKAPFTGVVSEVYVDNGVELGLSQPVAQIIDATRLRIRIPVHENEINSIAKGSRARVEIPALGLRDIPARITEKSLLPSTLSHSYDCTLEFDQAPKGVMPGMAVKAQFSIEGSAAITVPASAVQMDMDGRYVWLSDSGRVRKAHIEVGGYSGRSVVVSSGLEVGDKVIVAGYHKVSSGMEVTE